MNSTAHINKEHIETDSHRSSTSFCTHQAADFVGGVLDDDPGADFPVGVLADDFRIKLAVNFAPSLLDFVDLSTREGVISVFFVVHSIPTALFPPGPGVYCNK